MRALNFSTMCLTTQPAVGPPQPPSDVHLKRSGGGTRAAHLLIKRGYFVEEVAIARCSGVNSPHFSASIILMNPHQSETISPLE